MARAKNAAGSGWSASSRPDQSANRLLATISPSRESFDRESPLAWRNAISSSCWSDSARSARSSSITGFLTLAGRGRVPCRLFWCLRVLLLMREW